MTRPTDNKGWTVCRHMAINGVAYYQAVVIYPSKRREFIITKPTREEAIPIAITAAAKRGTLNWAATRIWCERNGVPLSYDTAMAELPQYRRTTQPSKGWYLENNKYRLDSGEMVDVIGVFFGRRSSDCIYQVNRPNRRSAVAYVLDHRHENPHYNAHETFVWLKENGMSDLVLSLRNREKAA